MSGPVIEKLRTLPRVVARRLAQAGEAAIAAVRGSSSSAERRVMEADTARLMHEQGTDLLLLANALDMGAHEARRLLIRESYLAACNMPPNDPPSGS